MSDFPYRYPLDLSGNEPNNRIVREPHDLTGSNLLFAPRQGSFYTKSMILEYKGEPLTVEKDFVPLHLNPHASSRSKKEVCTLIALRFEPLEPVYFTYQCVGGEYLNHIELIRDMVKTLNVDTRKIPYANITDLPTRWPAVKHQHNMANDLHGADPFIEAINRLSETVREGDSAEHQYILETLESIRQLHYDEISNHRKRIEILERVGVTKTITLDAQRQESVLPAGAESFTLTAVDPTNMMVWEKINGSWEPIFYGDDYTVVDDGTGTASLKVVTVENRERTFKLRSSLIGDGSHSSYEHYGLARQASVDEALNGRGTDVINATVFKAALETFRARIAADSIFNTQTTPGVLLAGETDIPIGKTGPVGIVLVLGGIMTFEGERDEDYTVSGDFYNGYTIHLNKPLTRNMDYTLVRNTIFGEAYAQVGRYGLVHLASQNDAINGNGDGAITVQSMHAYINHLLGTTSDFQETFQEISALLGDDPNLATSIINGLSERPTRAEVDTRDNELQKSIHYSIIRGY